MKKLFFLAFPALACLALLSSCSGKTTPESEMIYGLLQGTWESVHVEGHDYTTNAQTGEVTYQEDFNEDIDSPAHPDYIKMRLDRNNIVTLLELGDASGMTLPVSYAYTFNGTQLGGVVFSGDFANCMTIKEIDAASMTLELVDKGESDGYTTDYYELITFRKTDEQDN